MTLLNELMADIHDKEQLVEKVRKENFELRKRVLVLEAAIRYAHQTGEVPDPKNHGISDEDQKSSPA